MSYLDKLVESAERTGSIACMGLDPDLNALPVEMQARGIGAVPEFFIDIFDEMHRQGVSPGAFKPNQGFYVEHDKPMDGDFAGSRALANVIKIARSTFPGVPVILDFKRGDIAKSSGNYAREGLVSWQADAITVSPFMGSDSVMPFADEAMKHNGGVYVLNRTSNPGAKDFQNLDIITGVSTDVPKFYESVARKIKEWGRERPGLGAVVGATSLDELSALARFYSDARVPLLIPGVGGQGGKASEVMGKLREAGYDLSLVRINSSSDLTHPWAKRKESAPAGWAKVCTDQLRKLNEEIGYR